MGSSSLLTKLIEFVRTWLPVAIAVLIAVVAVLSLLVYHLYRVSGLDMEDAVADLGKLFTLDNVLLGLFVLFIGVGFSTFYSRRK